jgi:hypothetical protein
VGALLTRPNVQVLWKLMKFGDFQLDGADVDGNRLRVTSYLQADPVSLLRTGKLICVVHHGGSNSYHEALAYVFFHSEFHDRWPVIFTLAGWLIRNQDWNATGDPIALVRLPRLWRPV